MIDQNLDITQALAERRDSDLDNADPEIQVLAETSFRHFLLQIPIGRRHEPDVHRTRLVVAEAVHRTLFQHAEQVRLQIQRHLADLVEAEHAAIGKFKAAWLSFSRRAGIGAWGMSEQFTAKKLFRDRTAIEGDER